MERILVIEPEDAAREALESMLSDEGYDPVGVPTGAEAKEILGSGPVPDLVVLDAACDDQDVAIGALHSRPALRDVPLIVLSAGEYESRYAAAVAFLRKPFKPDDLLTKVREWVRDSYLGQVRIRPMAALMHERRRE